MMRYSKSPRRSLPGFAVDMALRDMRRKPEADTLAALKDLVAVVGSLPPTTDPRLLNAYQRAVKAISAAEASNG